MKRQINFCLFVLTLTFTGLIVFLVSIKNTPNLKNLTTSWTLLTTTGFSLWIFVLGVIRYTKQKYIEAISSDTGPREEFLRMEAIVSLPSHPLLHKKRLRGLINNKPVPKNIPGINKTIRYARIVFEEGLETNTS